MDDDLQQYSFYQSGATNRRQLFEDKDSTIRYKNKQNEDPDITFDAMMIQDDISYRSHNKTIHTQRIPPEYGDENLSQLQRGQSNFCSQDVAQLMGGINDQTYTGLEDKNLQIQKKLQAPSIRDVVIMNEVWRKQFFSFFQIIYNIVRFIKMVRCKLNPEMFNRLAIDIIGDKAFDKCILLSEKHKKNMNKQKKVLNRKKCKCFNIIKIINFLIGKLMICLNIAKDKFDTFMEYLDEKIVPWDPLSTFIIFWEHFQLVCLTFIFFYIPFRTNVQYIEICEAIQQFIFVDFIIYLHLTLNKSDYVSIVFLGDILVKMNTKFFYEGELIKNHIEILKNYFKSSFITDLIAIGIIAFPRFYFFSREEYLFLFLKMNSFLKIIDKIKENIFSVTKVELFNLFNIIILDVFIGHLVACEWIALGIWQQQQGLDNWIDLGQRTNDKLISLYIKSLYFSIVTMNTVGYGDFVPKTDLERAADMFVILVGCMLFGYSISKIGTILQTINKNKEKLTQSMGGVNLYMKSNDLGMDLQNKVRKYLEYIHLKRDQEQQSNDFITLLSKSLQKEILIKVQGNALKSVDIFMKNFSSEFLENLALKVKQIYFCSDETILQEDQHVEEPSFYILNQGCIEISFRDANCCVLKEKGEYFGQVEFFQQNQKSLYTIKSVGITSLFQIQLTDFVNLIQNYPAEKEIFYQISHGVKFHQRYQPIISACRICCSISHIEQNCHFVSYKPNMFKLIKSLHQSQSRSIGKIRGIKKKFNTLHNQKTVEDALYDTDDDELTEKDTITEKNGETRTDLDLDKDINQGSIKEQEEEYDTSSSSTNKSKTNERNSIISPQVVGFNQKNIISNIHQLENINKLSKQNDRKISQQIQGLKMINESDERKINSKVRFPSSEDLCRFEKPNNQQNSMTSLKKKKKKFSVGFKQFSSSLNESMLNQIESIDENDSGNQSCRDSFPNQNIFATKQEHIKKAQDKINKQQRMSALNMIDSLLNRSPSKSVDQSTIGDKSQKLNEFVLSPLIELQSQGSSSRGSQNFKDQKKQDQNDSQHISHQKFTNIQQQEGQKADNSGSSTIQTNSKTDIFQSKQESPEIKPVHINIQDTKNIQKRRQSSFFHMDPAGIKQLQYKGSDSNNQLGRTTLADQNPQQNNQLEHQFESLKQQLMQFMLSNTQQQQQQNQNQKRSFQALPNLDEKHDSENKLEIQDYFQQNKILSKEESQLEDIGRDYKLYFPWNNKTVILQNINKQNVTNNGLKQRIKQKLSQKIIKKPKK